MDIHFGIVTNEHYSAIRAIEYATWEERYAAWKTTALLRSEGCTNVFFWSVDVRIDDEHQTIKEIKAYGVELNYSMMWALKRQLNELGYYVE